MMVKKADIISSVRKLQYIFITLCLIEIFSDAVASVIPLAAPVNLLDSFILNLMEFLIFLRMVQLLYKVDWVNVVKYGIFSMLGMLVLLIMTGFMVI